MTAEAVPESPETDILLTAQEVATKFRVTRKTVWTWGHSGLITQVRTPGGHCRYREAEVEALIAGGAR